MYYIYILLYDHIYKYKYNLQAVIKFMMRKLQYGAYDKYRSLFVVRQQQKQLSTESKLFSRVINDFMFRINNRK